jgi:excisionase family DNA binding protein
MNLITIAEAAERLGVNQLTIRRWIDDGTLPAYRLGQKNIRIKPDDLSALLKPIK